MSNIPDYTEHLQSRQEAANRTREAFQNRMQPTIHVQLQVRKIVTEGYEGAKVTAYRELSRNEGLFAMMAKLGAPTLVQFVNMARVAKELDGTYTVTLP